MNTLITINIWFLLSLCLLSIILGMIIGIRSVRVNAERNERKSWKYNDGYRF